MGNLKQPEVQMSDLSFRLRYYLPSVFQLQHVSEIAKFGSEGLLFRN